MDAGAPHTGHTAALLLPGGNARRPGCSHPVPRLSGRPCPSPQQTLQELRCHGIKTLVLEPGFVATDMTVHQEGVLPERMIQPQDMALAALLPFRMSAAAQPLEVVLKLAKGAYKEA